MKLHPTDAGVSMIKPALLRHPTAMQTGLCAALFVGVLVACSGRAASDPSAQITPDTDAGGSSGTDSGVVGNSSGSSGSSGGSSGSSGSSSGSNDSGTTADTGTRPVDAGQDASTADADPGPDGPPQRLACTPDFGTGLSTSHGRIDGLLVALVPTSQHACNSDTTHLHLQVAMNGSTYDVAVNLDALSAELDATLPDGAWAEGWHDTMTLDYPTDLAIHSGSFTAGTVASTEAHLMAALANVNHISVFATGYGTGGAHLVHREGFGNDGAIFIEPLSPKAHGFLFHFDTQSF